MGDDGAEVEVDQTFIGGLARNMHKKDRHRKIKGTGGSGKQIVAGVVDRRTRQVVLQHVPDRAKQTLHKLIHAYVKHGATEMTDEAVGYNDLHTAYRHEVINHAEHYVQGTVHTNTMENFWSLLKRGLKGTYTSAGVTMRTDSSRRCLPSWAVA